MYRGRKGTVFATQNFDGAKIVPLVKRDNEYRQSQPSKTCDGSEDELDIGSRRAELGLGCFAGGDEIDDQSLGALPFTQRTARRSRAGMDALASKLIGNCKYKVLTPYSRYDALGAFVLSRRGCCDQ